MAHDVVGTKVVKCYPRKLVCDSYMDGSKGGWV